jgi:hypothetical protein
MTTNFVGSAKRKFSLDSTITLVLIVTSTSIELVVFPLSQALSTGIARKATLTGNVETAVGQNHNQYFEIHLHL